MGGRACGNSETLCFPSRFARERRRRARSRFFSDPAPLQVPSSRPRAPALSPCSPSFAEEIPRRCPASSRQSVCLFLRDWLSRLYQPGAVNFRPCFPRRFDCRSPLATVHSLAASGPRCGHRVSPVMRPIGESRVGGRQVAHGGAEGFNIRKDGSELFRGSPSFSGCTIFKVHGSSIPANSGVVIGNLPRDGFGARARGGAAWLKIPI